MTRILIISGDTVNSQMGGVGVRNWELARALSAYCDVTLAIPNQSELTSQQFQLVSFNLEKDDLRPLAEQADVILLHGFVLHFHPYLREMGKPLAVDLYVPSLLEGLVWHAGEGWQEWIPAYEEYLRVQSELLRVGDFFFCASERQRNYWLGFLHALKRLNPHTYRADHSLRNLIGVVPFGLPEGTVQHNRAVLKGVHPGFQPDDKVILWSGGLWDWLDPLTLIRAVAALAPEHPELKLYFLGTRHPNPVVSGMSMPDQAIALGEELGVLNSAVFFGDWTPYDERTNYLAEADLAVVSHQGHIETHFSFRTRVLDCIWAGIPMVITQGDAMADLVEKEGLGLTVPPDDVAAMAAAIAQLLQFGSKADMQQRFDRLRQSLCWNAVVQPLVKFCQAPQFAADKGQYLTDVERMSRDKDAFLQQVVRDKDAFWGRIVDDRDRVIERYRQSLPFRVYRAFRRVVGKKE